MTRIRRERSFRERKKERDLYDDNETMIDKI
jgi:hypothetical protein